jgi:hypothetical protein
VGDDFPPVRHRGAPRLHHLVVAEGPIAPTRRGVRDQGHAEDGQADLSGDDHLRHGGHPHGIRADALEVIDLRGGLVLGAQAGGVDPLAQADRHRAERSADPLPPRGIVGLREIDEPGSERLIVIPHEGGVPEQVQVVADPHQGAGGEVRANPPGGVGDDEGIRPEGPDEADSEGPLPQGEPLVAVHTPAGHHDPPPGEPPEGPDPAMADDGGGRQVGNLLHRDLDRILQGQAPGREPGSEDEPDLRPLPGEAGLQRLPRLVDAATQARGIDQESTPTTQAVDMAASVPPIIARKPYFARVGRSPPSSALIPPIWMAIEEKLAKPQSA